MTVVLVPWVTSSICMVIALLLLLVLLNWLKTKCKGITQKQFTQSTQHFIKGYKMYKPTCFNTYIQSLYM